MPWYPRLRHHTLFTSNPFASSDSSCKENVMRKQIYRIRLRSRIGTRTLRCVLNRTHRVAITCVMNASVCSVSQAYIILETKVIFLITSSSETLQAHNNSHITLWVVHSHKNVITKAVFTPITFKINIMKLPITRTYIEAFPFFIRAFPQSGQKSSCVHF